MRFDDYEWLVIEQVAALEKMQTPAWVQQIAYDVALLKLQGGALDRDAVLALVEELRQHRRVLTNIGGNLNDVAKAVNSTGSIDKPNEANTVLGLVRRVIAASDDLVFKMRTELLA